MAKITIIIPVYNAENYIHKCLDSIVLQDLDDIQAILVIDGATDSSETIINTYIDKYPNIFSKIIKENGGQGSARNFGLEKAIGEYVLFIDSDDYIEPTMLSSMYYTAIKNKSDLVMCDYYEVINNNKTLIKALNNISGNMKTDFIISNPSPWNKLIKTDILKENNIHFLEHHIYEDLATIPILATYSNRISYLQIPLYNYIIREGSTMRQLKYNKKLESIFVAIDFLEDQFKKADLYNTYIDEIEFLNIFHLLYAACGRFLQYDAGRPMIKKCINIINSKFPNWKKNKYFIKQPLKFKIVCNVFYSKNFALMKLYNKIKKIIKK